MKAAEENEIRTKKQRKERSALVSVDCKEREIILLG